VRSITFAACDGAREKSPPRLLLALVLMAVVGIAKPIGPQRGGEELEAGLKIFFRTYLVQTDDPYNAAQVVLTAPGLPAKGEAYVGHPAAVVVRRTPRPIDRTRLAWLVEVEWSTHSIDRDENPLLTRPEIEFGGEPFDEPLPGWQRPGTATTDAPQSNPDGSPAIIEKNQLGNNYGGGVLNTAGDPFDPPATRPNYLPVIRFTRNESEANFNIVKAVLYGNTVNSVAWNGLLPRQAWLKPIEASHEVHLPDGLDKPEILYWRVRYTFVLKAPNWDLMLLNIGPNYLDYPNTSTNPYPKRIPFLRDGVRYVDLLKPNGTKFSDTEEKKPSWIPFRVMREVEFAPLGININLPLNDLRRIRS
jgi:hypothetical protein